MQTIPFSKIYLKGIYKNFLGSSYKKISTYNKSHWMITGTLQTALKNMNAISVHSRGIVEIELTPHVVVRKTI